MLGIQPNSGWEYEVVVVGDGAGGELLKVLLGRTRSHGMSL